MAVPLYTPKLFSSRLRYLEEIDVIRKIWNRKKNSLGAISTSDSAMPKQGFSASLSHKVAGKIKSEKWQNIKMSINNCPIPPGHGKIFHFVF